jgi:hypothetical protein
MSWKPYVDLIIQDPNVQSAGIYGLAGGVWHQEGINVAAGEIPQLGKGAADSSVFQAGGIVAAGVKYFYLNTLANGTVVGRKGPTSILIFKTKQAFIVATTKENLNPGNVTRVEFVAKDLIGKGF